MIQPQRPNSVLVCAPGRVGNTRRVADAMAEVLSAEVVPPDLDEHLLARIAAADLVGFGSGVYYWRLDRRLRELMEQLRPGAVRRAFLFATSGFPSAGPQQFFTRPARTLQAKGIDILGTFERRGWDTTPPFNLVGGVRRGRPDVDDLQHARAFAARMIAS